MTVSEFSILCYRSKELCQKRSGSNSCVCLESHCQLHLESILGNCVVSTSIVLCNIYLFIESFLLVVHAIYTLHTLWHYTLSINAMLFFLICTPANFSVVDISLVSCDFLILVCSWKTIRFKELGGYWRVNCTKIPHTFSCNCTRIPRIFFKHGATSNFNNLTSPYLL